MGPQLMLPEVVLPIERVIADLTYIGIRKHMNGLDVSAQVPPSIEGWSVRAVRPAAPERGIPAWLSAGRITEFKWSARGVNIPFHRTVVWTVQWCHYYWDGEGIPGNSFLLCAGLVMLAPGRETWLHRGHEIPVLQGVRHIVLASSIPWVLARKIEEATTIQIPRVDVCVSLIMRR